MKFSIVLATCERPERLSEIVSHLDRAAKATGQIQELIVVDNSRGTETEGVVSKLSSGLSSLELVFVRTTPCNKAIALNVGIQRARGEYIAFTDDDCVPAEDWLCCMQEFMSAMDVRACGGRVVPSFLDEPYPSWCFPGRAGRRSWGGAIVEYEPHRESRVLSHNDPMPIGANFVVKSDVFKELGGYDEKLWTRCGSAALGCEDGEMGIRLARSGEKVGYCHDAVVLHPVFRKRTTLDYQFRYAYNLGYREPIVDPAAFRGSHLWNLKRLLLLCCGSIGAFGRRDTPAGVALLQDAARTWGVLRALLSGTSRGS